MMTNQDLGTEWRARFADFSRSGLTVQSWCAERGFSVCQFYYWRRKLASAKTPVASDPPASDIAWLSVPLSQSSPYQSTSLTVRVGAASIEISSGFDAELLAAAVAALAGAL
jgi:hypothetical protein